MTYTLPELSYDYAGLEPHISARIMELHHSKHHAAYVAGANAALEAMAEARSSNNFANLPKLEKDLAFNLGGHITQTVAMLRANYLRQLASTSVLTTLSRLTSPQLQ